MADELVDVVNEKDEVIGEEWKSKCHAEGIWHRVSSVYLFNPDGKIWLQKRAFGKENEGMFDASASGHVGLGESYEEGAYKEMREEIGIKTELKLFAKNLKEIENPIKKHIAYVYMGNYDGLFKLQEKEVEEIRVYDVEEIKKMLREKPELFPEGVKLELNALFEFLEK